jgi:hypothetical protein
MLVQFGVDFLELCDSRIARIRSIVDTSYECPQSRVVVESSQLFSNLNQLLDLPRSVFRLVVAQNQGNDPDNIFNKADDDIRKTYQSAKCSDTSLKRAIESVSGFFFPETSTCCNQSRG